MSKRTLASAVTAFTACAMAFGPGMSHASAAGDPGSPTHKQSTTFMRSSAAKSSDSKAAYDRIVAKLPADWQQRRDNARKRLGIESSPVENMLKAKLAKASAGTTAQAIDPTQYQCSATKLDGYVDSILEPVDTFNLLFLSLVGGLDVPTYDALLLGKPNNPAYALPAAYAPSLTTTFGYAQRFWDVRLNDVQLMAMHGTVFQDVNRVTKVIEFMYGVGPADAVGIAKDIISMVDSDPALKGGDHPIFTLNAFAFSGKGDPDPVIRKIPDKMIFGDGILAALKAIGLNKVGPRAVLGHEMAHHVQYEDNLFDSPLTGAEATRRTELMADGFSTYFLTHKKGVALNPTQVLQAEESFYAVGDCSFDSDGHHGTPNQRRAAASWGAATVAFSNNPNKVMPSLTLAKKFDKALPVITAPDAPTSVNAYRSLVVK